MTYSVPTYPSKRFHLCALKEAATWGTAVAVGAGDGLNVSNDGDPKFKQPYQEYDAINQIMPQGGDLGPVEAIDFSPAFESKIGLPYSPGALGSAIAGLFGTPETPGEVTPSTTAYKHAFVWADYMTKFFTFVTTRPGVIQEIASCMVEKFTLKVGSGYMQGTVGLCGNTLIDTSAINVAAGVGAITYESLGPFVRFQQGVLRMNAQSGGALASGDALVASDLSMDFERTITKLQVLGGSWIAQPYESRFKITVKVTLPYASAANMAYLDVFKALTNQKMDLVFTGGMADPANSIPFSWTFGFPQLKFDMPPETKLEDIIKNGMTFIAEEASSAPTGMGSYVRPYAELVNLRAAAYLT